MPRIKRSLIMSSYTAKRKESDTGYQLPLRVSASSLYTSLVLLVKASKFRSSFSLVSFKTEFSTSTNTISINVCKYKYMHEYVTGT